jgi:C-terminal processing protease CtpA/Prc
MKRMVCILLASVLAYSALMSPGLPVRASTLSARVEKQDVPAVSQFEKIPLDQVPRKEQGILGLDLKIQHGNMPVIQALLPDSPAARAHLQPGDRLVLINGQPTLNQSSSTIDRMLPDIPGETVDLLVTRSGQEYASITLTVMPLSAASRRLKAYFEKN